MCDINKCVFSVVLICFDDQFRCLVNRSTMGVNSLPKTVTRQLPVSLLGEQKHDGCEQFA